MKPLRRSRMFWSGVVVLGCLLGLWVDSMYRERAMVLHRGVFFESHGFLHREGGIEVFSQRTPGGGTRESWHVAVVTSSEVGDVPWFPAPHWETKESPTTIHRELGLPYWLIATLAAIGWAAMLWRRRRGQKSSASFQAGAAGVLPE
jgi:hypothetical protein